MKKVSVIIPVYNSEKYIKECIDSVLNQTYKNLEVIIVNDNSTDSSMSVIKSYKDKRIKIINSKKNCGVSLSRNKGVNAATGDFICFLDSDDYWVIDKIEKQVKFIKEKAFIYSDYEYLHNLRKKRVIVPKDITYKQALKNTTIFTSTVMFNMKRLKKKDIYMPDIKLGQDSYTWWQVLKKVDKAYGMNEVLATYRITGNSLSANKIKSVLGTWNILGMENKNIFKRLYYFVFCILNAIKRRV